MQLSNMNTIKLKFAIPDVTEKVDKRLMSSMARAHNLGRLVGGRRHRFGLSLYILMSCNTDTIIDGLHNESFFSNASQTIKEILNRTVLNNCKKPSVVNGNLYSFAQFPMQFHSIHRQNLTAIIAWHAKRPISSDVAHV